MGASTLVLAHLTITCTKQLIAKLNLILFMIYNAFLHMVATAVNGLKPDAQPFALFTQRNVPFSLCKK